MFSDIKTYEKTTWDDRINFSSCVEAKKCESNKQYCHEYKSREI